MTHFVRITRDGQVNMRAATVHSLTAAAVMSKEAQQAAIGHSAAVPFLHLKDEFSLEDGTSECWRLLCGVNDEGSTSTCLSLAHLRNGLRDAWGATDDVQMPTDAEVPQLMRTLAAFTTVGGADGSRFASSNQSQRSNKAKASVSFHAQRLQSYRKSGANGHAIGPINAIRAQISSAALIGKTRRSIGRYCGCVLPHSSMANG